MDLTDRQKTFAPEARVLDIPALGEWYFTEGQRVATRQTLARDMTAFGVMPSDIICLHVSMKSLGLVIGGPRTVIEALRDAVGPGGTIMMPTYSGDLSDPAEWQHPPVPPDMLEEIRAAIPAYDPAVTPTRGMGAVAEYFRTYPGARRSPHPQSSFAALGALAALLVDKHPFAYRFGRQSPLGSLVMLGGRVLMLGAPDDTASLFHLTQHICQPTAPVHTRRAPMIDNGVRFWAEYPDTDYPTGWFPGGMARLVRGGIAKIGVIGGASCKLFDAPAAFRELVKWRGIA
jgi:aminoglycoside 3-N-acetyltransferase